MKKMFLPVILATIFAAGSTQVAVASQFRNPSTMTIQNYSGQELRVIVDDTGGKEQDRQDIPNGETVGPYNWVTHFYTNDWYDSLVFLYKAKDGSFQYCGKENAEELDLMERNNRTFYVSQCGPNQALLATRQDSPIDGNKRTL